MKLLAIDAATEACSVALSVDGEIRQRHVVSPRGHAQRLLGMVDALLAEAGLSLKSLDAIAFDRGPGSFTGVRVGTSVTQGLAFGADLPVVPVSSLAILAQGAWQQTGQTRVLSVIDARMGEVYWGDYAQQQGIMVLQGAEQVSSAAAVTPPDSDWYGAGSGWQTYQTILQAAIPQGCNGVDPACLPHARDMLALAETYFARHDYVSAAQALPTYLRNKVANKQSEV